MRVLSASLLTPTESSMWLRVFSIERMLKDVGHDVTSIHYVPNKSEASTRMNSLSNHGGRTGRVVWRSAVGIPTAHLREVKAGAYDLVWCNSYAASWFFSLGRICGTPIIVDMHGIPDELIDKYGKTTKGFAAYLLGSEATRLALHMSDRIVCVSQHMIDHLERKYRIHRDKSVRVTNPVDIDLFQPSQEREVERLNISLGIDGRFVFGYFGGAQEWQGLENLVNASKSLESESSSFVTVLAGFGKCKREGSCIFLPRISRHEMPLYYSACDVLVLPRPSSMSARVAAPTKFAEYAAMGKPILTTNVGEASNMVSFHNCGIVVPGSDSNCICRGMREFLAKDRDDLACMGRNSRQLAEKEFSIDVVRRNLKLLIDQFVE